MQISHERRVKKLLKKWKQAGERDQDRLKLVKKEFSKLSLEEQKTIAGVMRIIKRLNRLSPAKTTMRIMAVVAFVIGSIFIPQSMGQPEKGVIQSEVASRADKPAESKKNQQTSKESVESTSFQAQEQQHTNTLNSSEDRKKNEIEIEREIGRYTGWLVLVGAVQFLALIVQAVVYVLTLRQMQDTDKRQLRAYVVC